jgi:hypothetical protein
MAQILGWSIFVDPNSQLLDAVAVSGPIALAEALVLMFNHMSLPPLISTLVNQLSGYFVSIRLFI